MCDNPIKPLAGVDAAKRRKAGAVIGVITRHSERGRQAERRISCVSCRLGWTDEALYPYAARQASFCGWQEIPRVARNDREGKLKAGGNRGKTWESGSSYGGESPVIQSEGGLAAALSLQRACAPGNSGQRVENAERRISCVGCGPGGLRAAGRNSPRQAAPATSLKEEGKRSDLSLRRRGGRSGKDAVP